MTELMRFVGPTFELNVPTDWFVLAAPQYQTMFLSPQTAEGWRANLTITLRPLEDDTSTPQQFLESILQPVPVTEEEQTGLLEVLEQGAMKIGGIDGVYGIRRITNSETGEVAHQRIVIAVHDDTIYIFGATRPTDGDTALLEKVDAIFEQMFVSLRFQEAVLEA